jgi:hypothetical protein
MVLRSRVTAAERPRTFAIVADSRGLHAERRFTLGPAPDGHGTVIVSDETQVGPIPWIARHYIGPRLHAANQVMFEDLARAAGQDALAPVTHAAA